MTTEPELTIIELEAIARHLIWKLVKFAVNNGHISWEDVPELTEREWEIVDGCIDGYANGMQCTADEMDVLLDIDRRELISRVS